jgi:hypothetical protein
MRYFYPHASKDEDAETRSLKRTRTLRGRHSLEWKAIPRVMSEDPDTHTARLKALLILGDGRVVESNAVPIPVVNVKSLVNSFERDTELTDLDDRQWFWERY